jgi:hypothetical protein
MSARLITFGSVLARRTSAAPGHPGAAGEPALSDVVGLPRIVLLDANNSAEDLPGRHGFLACVLASRRQRPKSAVRKASCQIDEMILGRL